MICPIRAHFSRRKQARPEEILDAAACCFIRRGFAATKMEDIAREAGVTKGTLYLYYTNKEELLKAVVRTVLVSKVVELEAIATDDQLSARVLLLRLLDRWQEAAESPQFSGLPKLMICEVSNFPDLAQFYFEEVILRARRLLSSVIQRGIARGEFRPVPVDDTVEVLVAPIIMQMIWQHSFAHFESAKNDSRQYFAHMMDLLLNGLLVEPHLESDASRSPA